MPPVRHRHRIHAKLDGPVLKKTLLQFAEPIASVCPSCGQHFSGDARFCPFDGEALKGAPDWNPSESDPLLGSVVDDRYEVQAVLGEGGMGTVYRAQHTSLGRGFALKVLRRDLAEDPDLAPRFIQEAKAAARVAHPNVVQITDFGSLPSGQPYFVMELLEGVALSRIIRNGAVSRERTLHLTRQIAEALAAAHAAGVIHRDLKPDNVLVVEAGDQEVVKVLDFGLARVVGSSRFTRKGVVFGTPHYMSPEQAAGEPSDHRLDIYALGVVMFEMLTGHLPFEADSFVGVLTKHIYQDPVRPSQLLGIVGDLGGLEPVVLRCLEKDPDARFASMRELVDTLDGLRRDAPLARASSDEPATLDESVLPRRRWPLLAGAGALLIVLLLAVGWGASSDSEDVPARPAATETGPAKAPEPPPSPAAAAPPPAAQAEPEPERAQAKAAAESRAQPRRSSPKAPAAPAASSTPVAAPERRKSSGYAPGEIINPWAE
jgi:serine/threonine-protein kinase